MLPNVIRFSATKLVGTGKEGVMTPDENGYYTLIIGGLNTLNSAGEYYTLKGAEALFESSSLFMRRIKNGNLHAEKGHPKRLPGMSDQQFISRILRIEETNFAAHISEVWLDKDYGKNHPELKNPDLVAIMAKVRPECPELEAALANKKTNVCFSIRALTQDTMIRGLNHRVLTSITTFDWVTEPGISIANKWDSPALEEMDLELVTLSCVESTIKSITQNQFAMESDRGIALETMSLLQQHAAKSTKSNTLFNW